MSNLQTINVEATPLMTSTEQQNRTTITIHIEYGSLTKKEDNETCSICLDPITKKHMYRTPCSHTFHKTCWDTYKKGALKERDEENYAVSISCPNCRGLVPIEATNYQRAIQSILYMNQQATVRHPRLLGICYALLTIPIIFLLTYGLMKVIQSI
jgi:Ring finger domain